MHYPNVTTGIFLSRPNRFLAHVRTEQGEVVCHVKNTGRLKELLLPGTRAAVQFHPDAAAMGRKTAYSLIAVTKPSPDGEAWVNIDSQAPNQAAYEWLTEGCGLPFCPAPENVRREVRFQDSRFDLSFSYGGQTWFMEVKGVTLDKNGTAMFPDAPTERGIKHLNELSLAAASGYGACVLFVLQMKGIKAFSPNRETHPEFADALIRARENGVHVWAYDCTVLKDAMSIDRPVPVIF